MRIKTLKTALRKNGYDYQLVMRQHDRLIYSQSEDGKIMGYEVFRVRLSKPHPKSIEDAENFDWVEIFPSDHEFGKRAWTYKTLHEAMQKYDALA